MTQGGQVADLYRELSRREALDVLRDLYPLQRKIIESPARFKGWLAGARSGKTYAAVRALYHSAIHNPGTDQLYIGLSRPAAKKLAWGPLLALCDERKEQMGYTPNRAELSVTFSNGSVITVSGAPDSRTIERFRGIPYKLVIIDECASYGPYLDYLVKDVLEPRLGDYSGSIILIGTPSGNCEGLFYYVTTGKKPGWERHHSTILDNPMFPPWRGRPDWRKRAAAYLREILTRNGWTEDNPTFRREQMAEWVPSEDDLLHHIPASAWVDHSRLPEDVVHLLGIDMGYHDETAFEVTGYSQFDGHLFEVDSRHQSRLSLTEIIGQANQLIERYDPEQIVIDPASGGLHLVSELSQRYSIPVTAADKGHKATWITLLQDDLANGRAYFLAGSRTGEQARSLRWNAQRTREREGDPCDCYDAYLYSYRHAYHWIHKDRPRELTTEELLEMSAAEAVAPEDEIDWY